MDATLYKCVREVNFMLSHSRVNLKRKMSRVGCAICSEALDLLDENRDVSTTKCGHVFHGNCLQQWLAANATCPQCRTAICRHLGVVPKTFFTYHDDTVCMTPSSNYSFKSKYVRLNEEIARLKKKCNRLNGRIREMQGQLKIAISVCAENKNLKANLKLQQSKVRRLEKQNSFTATEKAKLRSSLNELKQLRTSLQRREEDVHALLKSYSSDTDE